MSAVSTEAYQRRWPAPVQQWVAEVDDADVRALWDKNAVLRDLRWGACQARSGCCNKEDFLNLKLWNEHPRPAVPSLGWTRS